MQTFLPYADFTLSARSLDNQRLGKQRVEALQILRTLTGISQGWRNHPAVKMWSGHERQLRAYGLAICAEWQARGYRDTCADQLRSLALDGSDALPAWLGSLAFHLSHKSNLLRKLPSHYKPQWPDVPDNLPYVWPVGSAVELRA